MIEEQHPELSRTYHFVSETGVKLSERGDTPFGVSSLLGRFLRQTHAKFVRYLFAKDFENRFGFRPPRVSGKHSSASGFWGFDSAEQKFLQPAVHEYFKSKLRALKAAQSAYAKAGKANLKKDTSKGLEALVTSRDALIRAHADLQKDLKLASRFDFTASEEARKAADTPLQLELEHVIRPPKLLQKGKPRQ